MNASEQHQSKFKAYLHELLPAYIITFVFSYMVFVFEPILMYCTNQLDFWFDLLLMLPPMLLGFAAVFVGCAAVITAVYAANKAIAKGKEPVVYRILTLVLFFVFFATYLQGNFFAGGLPALDGSEIDWNGFGKYNVTTIIVWVELCLLAVIFAVKFGLKRLLKYVTIATGAVFIMLTVSLITEMISWNAFARKDAIITTNTNFDSISKDKNFVIFLADAVGSSEFGGVLNDNPEYKEVFEDFTYFPDTLGCYPCTRDTIPVVLGGALNKNETDFKKFSAQAYNNSPLFQELTERGYEINLYEPELIWYGKREFSVENSTDYDKYALPFGSYFREELKFVGFKYLPYFLKRHSGIESMDFNGLVDKFIYDDRTVYKMIQQTPKLGKTSKKSFRFIHTEGAHIPFTYDKDLNIIAGGTYEIKIEASITMINAYIERLKENDVYDNTVIIVMADHGNTNLNSSDDMLVRGNPMFMIKGIGEHHEFTVSDKPLSYLDLMDIFGDLLDDKSAAESVEDIPDERERYYMWYRNFRLEHHIEEYVVTDKAWEWRKFKKTGREFDL